MPWQGANVEKLAPAGALDGAKTQDSADPGARRSQETVEAALNRLSKAYSSAMECVGAWHRAERSRIPNSRRASGVSVEEQDSSHRLASLCKVAQAARKTFEEAILMDPLVANEHAPLLYQTLVTQDGTTGKDLTVVRRRRGVVELRSSGHRTTVKQLAYLSLVNYADLLLAGCGSTHDSLSSGSDDGDTILDRGLVKPLATFLGRSCWFPASIVGSDSSKGPEASAIAGADNMDSVDPGTGENKDESAIEVDRVHNENVTGLRPSKMEEAEVLTVRFALAAYIDATGVDGTDPTVWIKLACAARRLGRLIDLENRQPSSLGDDAFVPTPVTLLPFRRLEKHALEQAYSALPPTVAPNRTAVRALEQWRVEEEACSSMEYSRALSVGDVQVPERILSLPRYSWSTVGRMLLRATKHGEPLTRSGGEALPVDGDPFPPLISLQLSPLLALPSNVLGRICQYLDPSAIFRFEATCRGLSALIIAARATLDHQAVRRESMVSKSREEGERRAEVDTPFDVPIDGEKAGSDGEGPAGEEGDKGTSHRASLRLRSQLITSGKRSERQSRRTSAGFCLLASTLGITSNSSEYKQLLLAGFDWNAIISVGEGWARPKPSVASPRSENTKKLSRKCPAESSLDASLAGFVKTWSVCPARPINVLFDFVRHVSLHVGEIYAGDPGETNVLNSALLECFSLLDHRGRGNEDLGATFSSLSWKPPSGARSPMVARFAMDLLYAELRLRSCEREDILDTDFDGSGSYVSRVAPRLLNALTEVENDPQTASLGQEWLKLKIRCYWLNAGFYLWMGRLSHNVSESREAEVQGLSAIQNAISGLRSLSVSKIQTPHLVSPNRRGQHWRELSVLSLETFSKEIQASSVLLQAQEQFLEVLSQIDENEGQQVLHCKTREALSAIGDALGARYMSSDGSASADYSELVADFLGEHGDVLLSRMYGESIEDGDVDSGHWFDGVVPTVHINDGRQLLNLQRPCILTILLYCLQTDTGLEREVLELLSNICMATTELADGARVQSLKGSHDISFGGNSDSDSDDDSLSSGAGFDAAITEQDAHRLRMRQYSVLLRSLVRKVTLLYTDMIRAGEHCLTTRDCLVKLVHHILHFISFWFCSMTSRTNEEGDWIEDLRVFRVVHRLYEVIRERNARDDVFSKSFARIYTMGLIGIIKEQRPAFSVLLQARCERRGRSSRSKVLQRRADFVAAICCNFGVLLSGFPSRINGYEVLPTNLLESAAGQPLSAHIAVLCESIIWLWRAACGTAVLIDTSTGKRLDVTLERPVIERLRLPVGFVIVAMCGSATSTRCFSLGGLSSKQNVSLAEFYDSDSSARQWRSSGDDPEGGGKPEDLLRVIAHVAHCICQVLDAMEDAEVVEFPYEQNYRTVNGPFLPLVIARVLNRLADRLLVDFAEKGVKNPLWAAYPFGTRSTGRLIDSLLYKAYKFLHGFTIVNGGDSKDSSGGSSSPGSRFKPESIAAAAQLYRCLMRAYPQGRKAPPKLALDAVLAALPPLESTTRSKHINEYLFSNDSSYSSLKELSAFITRGPKWEASFSSIRDWVVGVEEHDGVEPEGVAMFVRRGISRLIAQGPIPRYPETGGEDDQRSSTISFEDELSRKFSAILDSLSLGNTDDYEAWYKAGQCLTVKADLIADRLGLSLGFSRCTNFTPTRRPGFREASLNIDELLEQQSREAQASNEAWIQHIGIDLSIFATSSWSSFESLQTCSKEIGLGYRTIFRGRTSRNERDELHLQVWYRIEQMKQKKDFIGWQQAWGGLFVSALRKIAFRCVRLALYNIYKRNNPEEESMLVSEVVESLGMNFYTEVMGSQVYGFPMQKMTPCRRRELAQASLSCLERAVDAAKTLDPDEIRPTWDLKLMIGKCHEKIAKTYWRERFRKNHTRMYEQSMHKALESYQSAIVETRELESSNELVVERNGGSSHGSHEVVYRLHASRLKCLIAAVDRVEDERDQAETEALRLTERHWFTASSAPEGGALSDRDRIWNVLTDVVTALAQCRLDLPFFHRSVYRHAQALLWAPTLSDPNERALGNLGTVPATRAFKLRGLNSTDAASSAAVVMGALFEKKRAQLCAVWVTSDSSDTIFQNINSNGRKYDCLRGKYITAYIETLRLCNRRGELETLLKYTYGSNRDLPSYFVASAAVAGGKPEKTHIHDCLLVKSRALSSYHLLTSIKRQANSALASVIQFELQRLTPKDTKGRENLLKLAYACYLRLNCDVSDVTKGGEWRSNRSSGSKIVVKALNATYLATGTDRPVSGRPGAWGEESQDATLLERALEKCGSMFPTMSGSFYSKKSLRGKKGEKMGGSKKRKPTDEPSRRSFEVAIPQGLSAGSTFLTSIQVGDKQKKVRLTVPEGASQVLRFALHVNEPEDPENSTSAMRDPS